MNNDEADGKLLSKKYRHGGAVLSITTILGEQEDFEPLLDWAKVAFEAKGLDVKVIHSGVRPAFIWEAPYEEGNEPVRDPQESDYG